jgi:hypothetical protein
MAYIWFCRNRKSSTVGDDVLGTLPFEECIEKLRITRDRLASDAVRPPIAARGDVGEKNFFEYHHVVVELDNVELTAQGWEPGFYRSPIVPQAVAKLLGLDQK